ncbi:EamA-like transporter family protein [Roseivivax jejudonensis]|uniref:EamA-like transporter family protein n=1 Tax=Roseivivax jejudonensis TaxID=1529041 RepID=A0A1X6Z707_9RHOB|nr:DMT family transporter [Roseivivax jejudonensis]SLN42170.1 EamA-like transporter family protein [Roseivivax jejudonensis]
MDNVRGITLMVLAMAGFAIEDAFIKAAADTLPIGQILLTIGIVGGGAFALFVRARGTRLLTRTLLHPAVIARNVAEIIGTIGFVTAITKIPLATASAIAQSMPLVITAGAALLFAEPVGWRRWCAILVGLAGVLVIIRPGTAGFDPDALWAVLAVFGLAARDLAARAVPATVGHMPLAAYGALMLIPTGLILIAAGDSPVPFGLREAGLLLGASVVGVGAYYAITSASRTGAVAVVTPFRYSRILFALFLGAALFGEWPDTVTLIGAAIIVASGLYTLLRERRLARAARAAAAVG